MQKYNAITSSNTYKFGTQFKPNKAFSHNTTKVENVFFKIIVPNYNNMAYIKKCLDSILEQTFQDFKIIVVDDLSTDGSDKFCEMYARNYPDKIQFIKLDQKGYSGKARNIGIDTKNIIAKYIWCIDGDDFIYQKNALKELYTYAKSEKYDAIFFNGYNFVNNNFFPIYDRPNINLSIINGCEPTYHTCKIIKPSCCGKYLENCMTGQDLYHQYKSFDLIKSYIQLQNRYYVYRFNIQSVTHKTQDLKSLKQREVHRYFLLHKLILLARQIKNQHVVKNIEKRIKIVKARIQMEQKQTLNKREVVISMASFPPRKLGMVNVISKLLPQCNKFYLWLNDYDKIPNELDRFDKSKLIIKLAKDYSSLKENGRYTWVNDNQNAYYLTVDDDIQYPSNYVDTITSKIDQYGGKAIMSFHGTQFVNGKEIYFPFSQNVLHDVQVHRVGGGVMGFIPSKIGFKCPSLEELKEWDGDASISVWATLNKIKKYVIAHSKSYLLEQMDGTRKLSLVKALCLNNETKQKRKKAYAKITQWEKIV